MIILFGGSFDPVHLGHLHVARKILALYSPEKFFLVPAQRNPLKDSTQTSGEHRLAMLQLAIQEISDPRLEVLDLELRRPGPSYTIATLEALRSQGFSDLALVMGNEVFASLPKWKEPKAVATSAHLIVVSRETSVPFEPKPIFAAVGITDVKGGPDRWEYHQSRRWLERKVIEALPFSATQIRDELAQRTKSLAPEVMPQGIQRSVWQYIKENRLYAVNKEVGVKP